MEAWIVSWLCVSVICLLWSGEERNNNQFSIDQGQLFGGDTGEGGIVGNVNLMLGARRSVHQSVTSRPVLPVVQVLRTKATGLFKMASACLTKVRPQKTFRTFRSSEASRRCSIPVRLQRTIRTPKCGRRERDGRSKVGVRKAVGIPRKRSSITRRRSAPEPLQRGTLRPITQH